MCSNHRRVTSVGRLKVDIRGCPLWVEAVSSLSCLRSGMACEVAGWITPTHGWVTRLLTDDSVRGVGELHSIRVRRGAPWSRKDWRGGDGSIPLALAKSRLRPSEVHRRESGHSACGSSPPWEFLQYREDEAHGPP
jgi:hypothetical protein